MTAARTPQRGRGVASWRAADEMPAVGEQEAANVEEGARQPSLSAANPVSGELDHSTRDQRKRQSKQLETNLSIVHSAENVRKKRKAVTSLEEEETWTNSVKQGGKTNDSSSVDTLSPEDSPGTYQPPHTVREDIHSVMKRAAMETKELLTKAHESLKESEDFEPFCLVRLEQLLKEANELEQSLVERKEKLKKKLVCLSNTLGRS